MYVVLSGLPFQIIIVYFNVNLHKWFCLTILVPFSLSILSGKRLYVRTVKHVSWIKRMPWTIAKWRKVIKEARWSGWVCVGECFFWYRPTRVVPDQRLLNGRRCCCTVSDPISSIIFMLHMPKPSQSIFLDQVQEFLEHFSFLPFFQN